jgi:hypothetical protein
LKECRRSVAQRCRCSFAQNCPMVFIQWNLAGRLSAMKPRGATRGPIDGGAFASPPTALPAQRAEIA